VPTCATKLGMRQKLGESVQLSVNWGLAGPSHESRPYVGALWTGCVATAAKRSWCTAWAKNCHPLSIWVSFLCYSRIIL